MIVNRYKGFGIDLLYVLKKINFKELFFLKICVIINDV